MKNFGFCLLALIPATFLQANCCRFCPSWHAVVGIESGAVFTSNAGRSATFPIESPGDQFYSYSPQDDSQTEVIYGGFIGAEWRGSPNWCLQFDLNYNQSTSFAVNGTLTQGVDVQSQDLYSYKYKIIIRQLLVEGKFSYLVGKWFRPYAIAGLGPSFNRAYSFSTTIPSTLTFTRTYKNNTTTGFTYAVGVGFDIELIKYLLIGVGYRFTDFGKASLGSASIDGTPVSGTLSQSHFYANEVLGQLTVVF